MDWIERVFGISPDGGDGSTEAAIVLACVIVAAVAITARVPRARAFIRARLGVWTSR
jgi:hypothetical protein